VGALTAVATEGNVVEGIIEGALLGAVAATATIFVPTYLPLIMPAISAATPAVATIATPATTFVVAGALGVVTDTVTQGVSHSLNADADKEFEWDWKRSIKTGFTTAIAGVIPTYGNPGESVLEAVGSLVMGFDASIVNSVIKIIIVNVF
jgi:hypothetical protein